MIGSLKGCKHLINIKKKSSILHCQLPLKLDIVTKRIFIVTLMYLQLLGIIIQNTEYSSQHM